MPLTNKQKMALSRAKQSARPAMERVFNQQDKMSKPKRAPRVARGGPQARASRFSHRSHFNGFGNTVTAPLAFSVGRCLPLQGMARQAFSTIVTPNHATVLICNMGPGKTVAQLVDLDIATGGVSTIDTPEMLSAGFDSAPSASSPSSAILTRGSVRLRNITKNLDVAGGVTALNLAAGFDISSVGGYKLLYDYTRSHPKSVTYTGATLQAGLQFNTHPVNQVKASDFLAPNTDLVSWKLQVNDPAFSTLVYIFWPGTDAQDYEVTFGATYQARYSLTGPLANAAVHPPTIPVNVLNSLRDGAEAAGSLGFDFLKNAASISGQMLGAAATRAAFAPNRLMLTGG